MSRVAAWSFVFAISCAWSLDAQAGAWTSQPDLRSGRYGFRWDRDWSWDQLAAHVRSVDTSLERSVHTIRSTTSLPQARVLFKQLSLLANPAEALRLPERTSLDRAGPRTQHVHEVLDAALRDLSPRDDLSGLLAVAERLSFARATLKDWFIPDLEGRPFKHTLTRGKGNPRIRIQFEFHVAESMLDKLSRPNTSDAEWLQLANEPVLKRLLKHRGPSRLTQASLVEWWRRASDPSPLNRLYEWIFPGSYYDFGGVSVNAEGYRGVIKKLRAAQASIEEGTRVQLSRYLPTDQPLDARVDFLFAADIDGWATGFGVGIDLEHFGDDFDHLNSIIAHECFHLGQIACAIKQTTLTQDSADRKLHDELMIPVWSEGIASYVGSPWRGAPSGEAPAHFRYAEEALSALRHHDLTRFSKYATEGIHLAGPLYKLGWWMAKRIEDTQGRAALVDIQTLGPAAFFDRYIQVCRAAPKSVPVQEQFSKEMVDAIGRVSAGIDSDSLLASARITRLQDVDQIKSEAARFEERFGPKATSGLAHLLLGDEVERRTQDHDLAQRFIVNGLQKLGSRAGELVRREGYLLLQAGAAKQAIEVFQAGVDLAPTDPDRLYMLGEGFRIAGQAMEARSAYRRALALNAQFEPARHGLALLE